MMLASFRLSDTIFFVPSAFSLMSFTPSRLPYTVRSLDKAKASNTLIFSSDKVYMPGAVTSPNMVIL